MFSLSLFVVSKNICGDWLQFVYQMLYITDLIQFTSNISGSQPLDRGHINREMWLPVIKTKVERVWPWEGGEGYEL